eukprot:scaffold19898_cov34-Tisochrysis_lutea.AAC.1
MAARIQDGAVEIFHININININHLRASRELRLRVGSAQAEHSMARHTGKRSTQGQGSQRAGGQRLSEITATDVGHRSRRVDTRHTPKFCDLES